MMSALVALAADYARQSAKRGMQVALLLLVALAFALWALAYAMDALWTQLALIHGPIGASLILAGGLAIVALLIAFAAWLMHRRRRPSAQTYDSAVTLGVPVALGLAARKMPLAALTLGAVAIAGVLLTGLAKRN